MPDPVATTNTQPSHLPLKDLVLAMLSLAAVQGKNRIPIVKFYQIFADMADDLPPMFPPLIFTRTSYSAYSKRLDDALQFWVGYGVEVPNPGLKHIQVMGESAERHLDWFKERYGEEKLEALRPLVAQFISDLGPEPTP